jgi:hypothetical protein
VRGIINSHARKAFAQWFAICEAVNAKKAKIKAAVVAFTPEGRAKKQALQKIAWIRKRNIAMQRALAGFRLSGCRRALHAMHEQVRVCRSLTCSRRHAGTGAHLCSPAAMHPMACARVRVRTH